MVGQKTYQKVIKTKEANDQARQMYGKAIALDPVYALAYTRSAITHWTEWSFGWSQDPQSLERAFELAQRALALDDSLPEGRSVLGNVYSWKKQHEKAIAELEKSVALNPNYADGIATLGDIQRNLSYQTQGGSISLPAQSRQNRTISAGSYIWWKA